MFSAGVGGQKKLKLGYWGSGQVNVVKDGGLILGVWWFRNESTHGLVQLCFKPGQPMGGRALCRSVE